MKNRRRYLLLVRIYAIAGVLTLALYAGVNAAYLARWRQTAVYSSSLAFEETVRAVDGLAQALEKSLYATDDAMCARVCGEAYAASAAAESAMSTLPFSTQELEQLSAFLNRAGDYAHTLCAESARDGLREEQRETLRELSVRATEFTGTLRELREALNGGQVRMDSREQRLRNVGTEPGEALSARLLQYESSFSGPDPLRYDGPYGKSERPAGGYLTEEEMLLSAAAFLDVPPESLEPCYAYEGLEGRRCYRCGDTFLCVSRSGVDSLSQTRLVSEPAISEEEARQAAETFLAGVGYAELSLKELRSNGTIAAMRFARTEDGAVWLDNDLSIAIALDDGSVYSFNTDEYRGGESGVRWRLSEEEAEQTLPEGFSPESTRRVILTSEGGRNSGCFEFFGRGEGGRAVRLYVDADDGSQRRITVE